MTDQVVYLRCERTGRHYRVATVDMTKNTVTFKGRFGEWTDAQRPKAEWEGLGYKVVAAEPGLEMQDG